MPQILDLGDDGSTRLTIVPDGLVRCDDCWGDGTITDMYGEESRCTTCDGDGWVRRGPQPDPHPAPCGYPTYLCSCQPPAPSPVLNIYKVMATVGVYANVYWHVVAETRGKARAIFIEYSNGWDCDYEWTTPMSIRLLAKGVDLPAGVDEDYVWAKANGIAIIYAEDHSDPDF